MLHTIAGEETRRVKYLCLLFFTGQPKQTEKVYFLGFYVWRTGTFPSAGNVHHLKMLISGWFKDQSHWLQTAKISRVTVFD
jgi:hypothetical protein